MSVIKMRNIWCGLIVLYSCSMYAVDDIPEGKIISHVRIEVKGGKKETFDSTSTTLEKSLKSKEQQVFSGNDFDEDLKFLSKEFDTVEPKISVEGAHVEVLFLVTKKPIIHTLVVQGNKAVKEEAIKKQLAIVSGDLFDRAHFNEAIQKVRSYYLKKGYFESDIQYTVVPVHKSEVSITLTIKEGKAGFVSDIILHNVTDQEEDEIKDLLMTKTYAWWHSWITDQGTYYQDIFRHDELAILSYLHKKGYLDATVESKVVPVPNKDRIKLDLTINKGNIYSLGSISFSGNNLFSDEEVRKRLNWKENAPFSQEELRDKTRDLYLMYGAKGYVDASIVPESVMKEHDRVYDVHFSIDEKKQYRIGLIQISGNKVTDASVILHESVLVPGDILNLGLLSKTEERLRNTNYFKTVNVYALKSSQLDSSAVAPFRDITIEVEENPTTANFSAFAGYSTTESVSGGVGVSESNFKMKGFSRLFSDGFSALRGGGENINLSYTLGTRLSRTALSWTKPYVFDTPWVVTTDVQQERNSYAFSDYTIKSKTGTVTGRYPLNAFVNYDLYYRIKDSHIDVTKKHDSGSRELRKEGRNDGTISAVGTGLEYDSTNNPYKPTQGTRSSLMFEYAGLLGDHHFASLRYLNTLFWKPWEKGVWKFRGNAQFIKTLFHTHPSQLPLDERLYLGGETSMRGYEYNTVGPHFHDKYRTPRGGMSSILFSGEYTYPLMKRLEGFVFFDAGNVYWKEFAVGDIRYTTGYGIKFYITEIAPLVIGLGYPLNPQNKKDVKRFFLSIGATF